MEVLCEQLLRSVGQTVAAALPLSDMPKTVPEDEMPTGKPTSSVKGAALSKNPSLMGKFSWLIPRRSTKPSGNDGIVQETEAERETDFPRSEAPASLSESAPAPAFVLSNSAPVAALAQEDEFGTLTWRRSDSAVRNAPAPAEARPTESGIRAAFDTTRKALQSYAGERGVSVREFSCTLIGFLLNTETGAFAIAHIGDGLAAAGRSSGDTDSLVDPPMPETGGSVHSFSSKDYADHLAVRVVEAAEAAAFDAFFLMTDGVADDCMYPPPDDILQRWSRDIQREMRACATPSQSARKLLQWVVTYQARGSWDDRTLIVVLRGSPVESHPEASLPNTEPEPGYYEPVAYQPNDHAAKDQGADGVAGVTSGSVRLEAASDG